MSWQRPPRAAAKYTFVFQTHLVLQCTMEYQRVGRGGAGNFYNAQDLEKASRETAKVSRSSNCLWPHRVDDLPGRRSSARCRQSSRQRFRKRGSQNLNFWPRWCWECHDEGCASRRHYCEYRYHSIVAGKRAPRARTLWSRRGWELQSSRTWEEERRRRRCVGGSGEGTSKGGEGCREGVEGA